MEILIGDHSKGAPFPLPFPSHPSFGEGVETSDNELETKLTHTQSAAERLVEAVVRGVLAH